MSNAVINKGLSIYVEKSKKRIQREFQHVFISGQDICLTLTDVKTGKNEDHFIHLALLSNLDENIYHVAIVAPFIDYSILFFRKKLESHIQQLLTTSTIETWHPEIPTFGGSTKDCHSSKNIYIFTEEIKTSIEDLVNHYREIGYNIKIRDNKYRALSMKLKNKDIFVCHDSRDKKNFVIPLVKKLRDNELSTWYDEYEILIGDSIHEKVNEGLKNCKYGIIVISQYFLSNQKWIDHELNSLQIKEKRENKKILLPIWLNVTEDDIAEKSLILLDRKGLSTNVYTLDEIVSQIVSKVSRNESF